MLGRNDKNKLKLNTLDLQIFLDDLFVECENEDEVEWLKNKLMEYVDIASDERKEMLNVEEQNVACNELKKCPFAAGDIEMED